MVFYLTGTGNYLYVAKQFEENSIWYCYQRKFPMATPLQKQDGGLCYVLRDTLGESAWDSGIYKRAGRFLMSSQSDPPAYQAYCGGTVNWSLSQGVVGEPSLLLSPVAAGDPKMPTIFERMEQLGNSKPVLCHLKNGFQFQNDVVHLTQRISL